jgi:hypothetical protein
MFQVVPAAPTVVAGVPFEVTIVALDGDGAVDTAYAGLECVSFSGPDDAPDGTAPAYPAQAGCAAGSSVSFTSGIATVSVGLVDPETTVLQVTDSSFGLSGTSKDLTVSDPTVLSTTTTTLPYISSAQGGSPTSPTTGVPTSTALSVPATGQSPTTTSTPLGAFLVVPAARTAVAGVPFEVTIAALDGDGAVDAAYAGLECVSFSGPDDASDGTAPDYPAQGACAAGSGVTFTSGIATVGVDLVQLETTALEVTDDALGVCGASGDITVVEPSGLSTTTSEAAMTTGGPTTTTLGTTTTTLGTTTISDPPTTASETTTSTPTTTSAPSTSG